MMQDVCQKRFVFCQGRGLRKLRIVIYKKSNLSAKSWCGQVAELCKRNGAARTTVKDTFVQAVGKKWYVQVRIIPVSGYDLFR
jgi:hypothetical protein